MGTLFAFISLLLVIGSVVTAFKPSLIRQQSRLKAFALCWMASSVTALMGSAFDGNSSWTEVFWGCVILAVLYGIVVFFATLIRNIRLSPEARQQKVRELKAERAELAAEGRAIFHQATKGLSTNRDDLSSDDDRFMPKSFAPAAAKTNDGGGLDNFEQSLTTLWTGDISTVEFTYVAFGGERSRRKVDVDELAFNERGQFYLRGFCHKRQEQRTFKVENIETQFKVGSKRYEFEDWCEDVLGLPPEAIDDIQSRQGA